MSEPSLDAEIASWDPARDTTGASVLRGSAWNFVRMALPQLTVLALSITAARVLGPEEMGRQSFISFVALSVIMVLTSGLPPAVARYASEAAGARRQGAVGALIRWCWQVMTPAAVLGGLVLLGVAMTQGTSRAAWVLAAIGAAITIVATVPSSAVIAMQEWRVVTLLSITVGIATTVAAIVVLLLGGGITGMFAVEAVSVLVSFLATTVIARRTIGPVRDAGIGAVRGPLLQFAAWATIGALLTFVIWRRSEFLFLARYSGDDQIAVYSVAFAAAAALVVVTDAVAGVLAPAMATLVGAGEIDRIRAAVSRSLRLLLLGALPITTGALAVGPAMLRSLYGADYNDSGAVFVVLMLPFPLLMLRTVCGPAMVGFAELKPMLVVGAIAAALNVAVAFLLVPDHGPLGAAWANATAQTVYSVLSLYALSRVLGWPDLDLGALARASLAAAAAGVAALAVVSSVDGALGVAFAVLAGIVAFGVIGVALRVVPTQDGEWLCEVVSGRLGPPAARVIIRATAQRD